MEHLETPEARFAGLKDRPFDPHDHAIAPGGLRMHYVDEGLRDAGRS
jgi:hypothetical protein